MTYDEAVAALTGPGGPFELVHVERDGVPMRQFAKAPASLVELLESSSRFDDRAHLVYEDDRYTFRDVLEIVAGLAQWMAQEWGVSKGDRVAIGMRNYPEWVLAFWATQALGAVAVPLNAWWIGPELRYALEDSQTAFAFVDGERYDRIGDDARRLRLPLVVVRFDGPLTEGAVRWSSMLAQLDRRAPMPRVEISPDDDATILYTSGTTGQPKGAIGTHGNHVTNVLNMSLIGAVQAMRETTPDASPTPPATSRPPAVLQTYPFFHIGGLTMVYMSAASGTKVVLQYKWDLERALELIEREQVTSFAAVPTILRQVMDSPLVSQLGEVRQVALRHGDRRGVVGDREVDHAVGDLHVVGADVVGRDGTEAARFDHRRTAHTDVRSFERDDDVATAEQGGVPGEAEAARDADEGDERAQRGEVVERRGVETGDERSVRVARSTASALGEDDHRQPPSSSDVEQPVLLRVPDDALGSGENGVVVGERHDTSTVDGADATDKPIGGRPLDELLVAAPRPLCGDHERPVLDEGAGIEKRLEIFTCGSSSCVLAPGHGIRACRVERAFVAVEHAGQVRPLLDVLRALHLHIRLDGGVDRHERLTRGHALADGDKDVGDAPRHLGNDLVLHLHRFEDDDGAPRRNQVADRHLDRHDSPLQGRRRQDHPHEPDGTGGARTAVSA